MDGHVPLNPLDVLAEAKLAYDTLMTTDEGQAEIETLVERRGFVPLLAPTSILPEYHTLCFNAYLYIKSNERSGWTLEEIYSADNVFVFALTDNEDELWLEDEDEEGDLLDYYLERLVCLKLASSYHVTGDARLVLRHLTKYLDLYNDLPISLRIDGDCDEDLEELVLGCRAIGGLNVEFTETIYPVPIQEMPVTSVVSIGAFSEGGEPWMGEPRCHPSTLQKMSVSCPLAPPASFMDEYLGQCSRMRYIHLSFGDCMEPWSMRALRAPLLTSLDIGPGYGLTELPDLRQTQLERLVIEHCPDLNSIPDVPSTLTEFDYSADSPDKQAILPVQSMARCHFTRVRLGNVHLTEDVLATILTGSRDTLECLDFCHPEIASRAAQDVSQLPLFEADKVVPLCRSLTQLSLANIPRVRLRQLSVCRNLSVISTVNCAECNLEDIECMLSLLEIEPTSPETDAVVRRNRRLHASAQTLLQLLIWQNRLSRIRHRVPDEVWFIIFTRFF